jgi:predicted nuclease of predicted toxin-antitoxin system
MRRLLDTCVWGKAADEHRAAGHDVDWAGDWSDDPGDEEILTRAHVEGRILVTLDKDFGELVIVRGMRHSGLLRVANTAAQQQSGAILNVLRRYGAELQGGAVITAEPGRVRIRPPDQESAESRNA